MSTEEEISAMKKELDKYGIQMPAFGKIGGILASEVCFNINYITKLLLNAYLAPCRCQWMKWQVCLYCVHKSLCSHNVLVRTFSACCCPCYQ